MKPTYHAEPPAPSSGWLASAVRAWDRFWFRPADPLPLGVIRALSGAVILYIHLIYSLDLLDLVGKHAWIDTDPIAFLRLEFPFYSPATDWGDPAAAGPYANGMPLWSIWFHVSDPLGVWVVHVTLLSCMFLFTIGFATRITGFVTWAAIIGFAHRLPTFVFGMDSIMAILAFYLMIGPSGATLSVDNAIARRWARRHGRTPPQTKPLASANFTLRLMQVHFCIIYLASGLSKLQGPTWWNGNALWGTMANYSFAPMHWPAYQAFLVYLCQHRVLWEVITTGGSYFTLALEIGFPFLIWRPSLRWLMICLSVLLHTGIGLIMGLSTFSLCMMCLLLAFVPAETMRRFLAAMRGAAVGVLGWLRGEPRPARKEPAMAR